VVSCHNESLKSLSLTTNGTTTRTFDICMILFSKFNHKRIHLSEVTKAVTQNLQECCSKFFFFSKNDNKTPQNICVMQALSK
jgi:hypothetical protein